MLLFYIFISIIIIQRILEFVHASQNRKKMLMLGAMEYDIKGYRVIVTMHVLFFISLFIENIYHGNLNKYSALFFCIFLLAQVLRFWSIKSLGIYWNTRIIFLKGSQLVKRGPYKFFKHPNYLAVVLEFITIPFIFSLYYTAIVFSILNLIILIRRIRIEEKVIGINLSFH